MKRIIVISILILLIILIYNNCVYAITPNDLNGNTSLIEKTDVINISNSVIYIFSIIGSGVSVVTLIILGIKYMMGSLEQKAEYKKTLMPYIIGAVLIFGASVIAGMIFGSI